MYKNKSVGRKQRQYKFIEHNDYKKILDEAPEYFKPVITFAYKSGWRKSEIFNLRWDQVDLKNGFVKLGL